MFRKNYKVKGEDVDDFMVMQDFAYHSYNTSTLMAFLLERGYSKQKLNASKEYTQELIYRKHLMFTQLFFVNIEFYDNFNSKQKMKLKSSFYNAKNELCAMVITQFNCFNCNYQEITSLSKNITGRILIQ